MITEMTLTFHCWTWLTSPTPLWPVCLPVWCLAERFCRIEVYLLLSVQPLARHLPASPQQCSEAEQSGITGNKKSRSQIIPYVCSLSLFVSIPDTEL